MSRKVGSQFFDPSLVEQVMFFRINACVVRINCRHNGCFRDRRNLDQFCFFSLICFTCQAIFKEKLAFTNPVNFLLIGAR